MAEEVLGMAEEVLGILSSADCLGCTLAKVAAAGADEEEGVDDEGPATTAGVETGAPEVVRVTPEVAGVTSIVGAAAGTATGVVTGATVVVVGVVTGAPEVVGVACSTPAGCSVGAGVALVGINSAALGFSEAELEPGWLGLTEATAVGAAIWRIAGTAAVRGWVVRMVVGLIGSTR
jgi:hypothetical protein